MSITRSITLCMVACGTLIGYTEGFRTYFDNKVGDHVLDVPSFPANLSAVSESAVKRDLNDGPVCDFSFGLAHINDMHSNLDHLKDVGNQRCVALPGQCARLATMSKSSIFFCNKNDETIHTKCRNLIKPAQNIYKTCRIASTYTYGYEANTIGNQEKDSDYYLCIGGEFPPF